MATEADVLAPVCDARGEQGGNLADEATHISMTKHLFQSDTHNGLPAVEGDNFLTPPSIAEVHCEVNNAEKPNQTDMEGEGFRNARNSEDNLEAETYKSAKNTSLFIKEDALIEKPAASLQGASENVEASYLGQENSTESSAEDQTPYGNLHENTRGETVEMQKEDLEKFPPVSNENVKDDSVIKSDSSATKDEENDDEELRKAALSQNEKSAERIGQNIESQIERGTRSCTEEQRVTHLQGILDENTVDETIDEGVTKGETPDIQKEEQGGNQVEHATDNSITKLPSEEQCLADTHNELPTVEGENFLKSLSTDKVHCEGNAPDVGNVTEERNHTVKSGDQPLEIDASEERSSGEIQQNAEESKGSAKDETKELEGEELNVQGETTDEKTVDGKTTEEDISRDLMRDVPEGECDQHKISSEQEGLGNGRKSEDKLEAELFESEQNRSTLLKEDAQIEIPAESLHEDHSEGTGGNVKEKTADPVEPEKEVHENSSSVANEVAEIKLDATDTKEEHSGKEGEKTSLLLPLGTEATEEPREVAFCENEKNTESTEPQVEKTEDSLLVVSDNTKAPEADQEIETSSTEEQSVTAHPRAILDVKAENEAIDAAARKEETHCETKAPDTYQERETSPTEEQSVTTQPRAILDVKTEDEAIAAAARKEETRDETKASDLGEQTERPSLAEASPEDANDGEPTILIEPKFGDDCPRKVESLDGENIPESTLPEKEELQYAPEDHDASGSREDIVTTSSPKEVSLVTSDETTEHTEENSVTHEDCSQMGKDSDSSLTEAPIGETNADEPEDSYEPKDRSGDSVKAELENEKYTGSDSVKEEAQVENPGDCLQASDSSQDTKSRIEEETQTAYPHEISSDKRDTAERNEEILEVKENVTNILDGDNEDNLQTEVAGSQKPSPEEAATGNSNDPVPKLMQHEAELVGENKKNTECTNLVEEEVSNESLQVGDRDIKVSALGQDRETSSKEGQIPTTDPQETMDDAKEDETNDATSADQETPEEKNIEKTTSYEETKENLQVQVDSSLQEQNEDLGNDGENSSFAEPQTEDAMESTLVKKEVSASEDVEASASCQETSHLEEQNLITDAEEVKTVDGTELKEETPDDKNFGSEIPHVHTEENSVTQVECLQKEDLEKDSENSTEASAEVSIGDESKDTYKLESKGIDSLQAELEIKENTSFKEEALVQKPIDSLQQYPEDITASDLSQDTNISLEKKILTYPQEISRDKIEEEPIPAADSSEDSLEVKCIARSIPDNYEEDSSPIEEDGSEKPSLEDASTGNNIDEMPTVTPEAKLGGQTEKDTECPLVKEEESIESSHVEALDIKAATSGQYKETSSLEEQSLRTHAQGIIDDTKEERTSDAAGEEETLEDKNIAESTPYEETGEDTGVQVDHSELEQNEVLEKDSEKASLSEAPTMDPAENILVKEEAQAQDHQIESLQVATEVIEARASCQETSFVEEKIPTADSQFDHKEQKIIDSTDLKEETPEDKSYAASSNEDTRQNSLIQEDCSNLEHQEKDVKSTSVTEAPTKDTTESTLVKEEARAGDHIDSLHVATDDIKAFAQCQETEIEEQVLIVDPDDIPRDNTNEKTEVQDTVEDVPRGDDVDNSPTKEYGSQKPSFEKTTEDANDHESATTQEAEFLEESSIKGDLFRKEKTTEGTLVEEDASIEPPQLAAEDIKAPSSSEDREPISQEEQILDANPGGFTSEEKQEETGDPTDVQKETSQDEEAREIEDVNTEPTSAELKEEDGDFKDPQLTTAVSVEAPDENDSNSLSVKIPYTKDLDINEDGVGNPVEDPSCKQEESSTTKVPDEYMITGNENISDITSLESEVSEQKNDHTVVEEEKSCGDKTDTKELGVMDENLITIPTNETLAETDPRGSKDAEVQVPDGEQKADLVQQDPETETAPDSTEEQLLTNSSQAVPESEGVNGEERVNTDNCKERSGSYNSVAVEEISPSNVDLEEDSASSHFQESKRQTREEAEKEEAQEQEEEVHVSALTQDSSMEKVENDVQWCVASAVDSDATHKMPELEEPPLSAPDESITETTECKETEVVEKSTKSEEDGTKSLLDDKKDTGEEQEEIESEQETTEFTSVAVANDFIPVSASEPSKVDDSITKREVIQDTEELHSEETAIDESVAKTDKNRIDEEQKITDFSPAAPNMSGARNEDVPTLMSEAQEEDFTEECTKEVNDKTIDTTDGTVINESTSLEGILVDNRSITDLESKIDDEAPEISETTPTVTECESTSFGKLNEEKSDSNETACEMGKQKSEYESKTQVLESVQQDQSCETISDIEETKTEEKNLEAAAAETKSGEVVSVDISEQDETTYEKEIKEDNISGDKTEDEDVGVYHRGSCEEEVITESHIEEEVITESHLGEEVIAENHLGEQVKQEEEITTEKVFEVTKIENATEKVPETSKEADDRAPIESHSQETEQVKSVEEVTDTKEAHELDITCVKTGTQDSSEEINSSSAALLESEDTKTRANDTNNEKAREGLLTQELNIPEKEAATRELPKGLDENTTCEAPPMDTVHYTTSDTEAKKEYTNTIVMQPQEEDSTPKHEALPLLQSAQGKECEEQNQKDEICSSDEVQPDSEGNMMLSARTNEEENKADTWGKPNEDEDTKTDAEAEKLDCSSRTKDILEVSSNNDAPSIPNGGDDFATKDKSSEESQISANNDEIEHAPEDTRVTTDSPSAIPNATAVQSQQVIGTNDKCEVMAETKLQGLPEEFSCSNYEDQVSEKDDPLNLQNERHIGDDVHVLIEESSEVSKKENPVAKADADEIENAPMSEALEKAIEQHQSGSNSENVEEEGVICEDKETIQRQIDSLPILPAEEDPPVQIAGLNCTDVTESEAAPPPAKDAKPDEQKDDEESPDEQKGSELSSEAPVMVDIGDADVKASHKKSHNILSGVGSRVKHSIAKVKKVITGKSSHPKPPSPKKVDKYSIA